MLYLTVNPLFPSIACKSFGGSRNVRSTLWRSFTSGSRSEMPRNKCPFFYLFWTGKKDKREKTPIILSSKSNLEQTN